MRAEEKENSKGDGNHVKCCLEDKKELQSEKNSIDSSVRVKKKKKNETCQEMETKRYLSTCGKDLAERRITFTKEKEKSKE